MAIAEVPTGGSKDVEKRTKLQHFLMMKAFNLRKGKQTLTQQFQGLRHSDNTGLPTNDFIELDALCSFLSIPPFRRLILCQVFRLAPDATQINFNSFLRFLQTASIEAANQENVLRSQDPPPPPPSQAATPWQIGNQDLVCFQPSLLSMRFAHPPPAPGLWKKREITIQERITEYTKIDEQGRPQHLVEKERHQTEVIHMESLQGEFAHREITQFEQLEQLNDEVVHHDHGREEFVHLKSQHDEVSRFESSIPTNMGAPRPEECEQAPPSPTIKRDPSAMDGGMANHFAHADGTTDVEYFEYQSQFAMGAIPREDNDGEMEGLMDQTYTEAST